MITAAPHLSTPPKGSTRRANALPSNHLLDEYRIDAILGAGGFGVTYKALDTHLENWVAIKEYFPIEWSFRAADGVTVYANTQGQSSAAEGQLSDYEWGLERFLDEARVLARVQHPYVVRVKRYFRGHGTAYIVMDYEEGEPLSAMLRDGETLGEEQMRGLLEDVLPALQAVHEQGYLHRDIKPSNLYVRSHDRRVILIDFGAARAAISRHSQSVSSLVTPGYSPPEQYSTRNDRYGPWTDIYALGAVLYRCIAGQTPVEAADRLMDDTLKPAVAIGAGRYSTNLLRVIDRALAVRPEQRFQDMIAMQAGLGSMQDADSDETVIMAPLSKSSKSPAQDIPALRTALESTDHARLEIAGPSTAGRQRSNLRSGSNEPPLPLTIANGSRWRLWGILSGSAGLVVLVAIVVWLWISTSAQRTKPLSPPDSASYQQEYAEIPTVVPPTSVTTVKTPTSLSASGAETTPPAATAEKPLPVVPPVVTEPVVSPAPHAESGAALPVTPSETESAQSPPVELEPPVSSATGAIPETSESHSESEAPALPMDAASPVNTDDQRVPTVTPDSTIESPPTSAESGPVKAPLTPAIVPTRAKPRSSTTTEQTTIQRNHGKKLSARNPAQPRPRVAQQKVHRDRTQPQSFIAAPAAPARRASPTRRSALPHNNPWDSPTSTGFNQK